jgi:AraC-like DNA-binding protein
MAARARSVALERHVLEAEITCAIAALAPAVNALQARGIDASLAQGMPTLTATAKTTQRTPRTLQRELAAEGTTFVALLDEVRRDLALKYVKDGVGLAETSFMLHFADVSAFHRAFKRWTRMTPGQYRARPDVSA